MRRLIILPREVLAPMAASFGERVQIEGPSVTLNPRAALSLTMALTELATNASEVWRSVIRSGNAVAHLAGA